MSVYFLEKLMGYGYVLGFCFVFRFKRESNCIFFKINSGVWKGIKL